MTRVPLTVAHVEEVFANLHPISREEMAAFAVGPDQMRCLYQDVALTSRKCWAAVAPGGTVAVMFARMSGGTVHTWLTLSTLFDRQYRGVTIQIKAIIRDIIVRYPVQRFQVASRSTHPQAGRWLNLLGFTRNRVSGIYEMEVADVHRTQRQGL